MENIYEGIIVEEKVIVPEVGYVVEQITLPGEKGDDGEPGKPFTYDDFTPEQIADLKRPATEAAAVANAAAQRAEAAAESVQGAVEDAEQASQSAQQAATEAQEAVTNANAVIGKAETAINNANTAAATASTAVESVNALEERVEQAEATRVQSERGRQENEVSRNFSEQQREANETERKQKFAQIESDATALKNSLNEAEAQRVSAENAREEAETQRETAEQERTTQFSEIKTEAENLITQTTEAKNDANTAATSATNAAEEANTAAGLANEAAETANQAAQNVDGRVSALEEKASQVYENLAAIEASGETNPNKIYIDLETMQPYIYKGGEFVPFKGGEETKIFRDVGTFPLFYFKDGLFFYLNSRNNLCSWNEETNEVIDYNIYVATHSYHIDANSPFIYRDGKIIVITSKGITCYNLETKEELWSITMKYYDVVFNEYKDFIYLQDGANKQIIKLISIEDGSTIKEFNLTELSGETSGNVQDFGECEINGYCYFSNDNGHIFKISNENGYIEYVGKIDGVRNISFNNNYVFMLGDYKIFSAAKSVFEDGTLTTINQKDHIQNTYLVAATRCKIINDTFYAFMYKIAIDSTFYGNYIYETLDMSHKGRGKAIKGNKGYVMIKERNTVNEKPFYVKYDLI